MKKITLAFVALFAILGTVSAQKYAHLNYGNLLNAMPAVKDADKQLEDFQKALVSKGEEMSSKLKEGYLAFLKDQQSQTVAPVKLQERQAQLEAEQAAIQKYEETVREQIGAKREALLKPILDRVNQAIKDVAKEKGYSLVFDTSSFNAVLFAKDTEDLFPLMKTKLGIQ
jgi:outer membrane protein